MRTTLNIADDVLAAAKDLARRQRTSTGEVLSELARKGLLASDAAGEIAEGGAFYGFEPLPKRGPVVSNILIDRLREDEPE